MIKGGTRGQKKPARHRLREGKGRPRIETTAKEGGEGGLGCESDTIEGCPFVPEEEAEEK